MNIRCALLICLFSFLTGAALHSAETDKPAGAATPKAAAAHSSRGDVLTSGDTVGFQIVEDKDGEMERRISDTGDLDVPYIGRVHVAGKSCDAAAAEIKKRLEQDYYYQATVRLAINQKYTSNVPGGLGPVAMATVNVSGAQGVLRAAGPQTFPKTEKLTISAAVLKAGPTMFANQSKVELTRKTANGTEKFTIDIDRILKKGEMDQDKEVKDGDYIYVPKKGIVTGF